MVITEAKLKDEAKKSLKGAYAQGTLKNLVRQRDRFLQFCNDWQEVPVPVSVETLLLYMQFLAGEFASVETIGNYVYGVKLWYMTEGWEVLQFDHYLIKMMKKGLKRRLQHTPRQALPITPEILLEIRSSMDMEDPQEATYWALFLMAFFLVCRKSNLVPDKKSAFDCNKQLSRGHFKERNGALMVSMKWTKTIQFGERVLVIPILPIKGSNLCPVRAYHRMCDLNPAGPSAPAFIKRAKGGEVVPIVYREFQARLKMAIECVGRDPSRFSSHSFRRGAASFAYEAGVPAETVKVMGDWASDCFRKYLQVSMACKTEAASKIGLLINKIEGRI